MREKSKEFISKETFESNMNDLELTFNDKIEQYHRQNVVILNLKLEESTKIITQQVRNGKYFTM